MGTRRRTDKTSSAGGVAGGTALIAYAKTLPEGSFWRAVIIFAAPTVSVLLIEVFSALRERLTLWWSDYCTQISERNAKRIKDERKRVENEGLQEAKRIITEHLSDANTPDEQRLILRKREHEITMRQIDNAMGILPGDEGQQRMQTSAGNIQNPDQTGGSNTKRTKRTLPKKNTST